MIYHMLPKPRWQGQSHTMAYMGDTLESEGFIHCTGELDRLIWVANHFYRSIMDEFVILCIDESRVDADIRWEEADGHRFPHIYGPLNLDAIIKWVDFPRDANGVFSSPMSL
ncbi:MAG: DUF952 domain-containing protein [Chloroflexota bacterium]